MRVDCVVAVFIDNHFFITIHLFLFFFQIMSLWHFNQQSVSDNQHHFFILHNIQQQTFTQHTQKKSAVVMKSISTSIICFALLNYTCGFSMTPTRDGNFLKSSTTSLSMAKSNKKKSSSKKKQASTKKGFGAGMFQFHD